VLTCKIIYTLARPLLKHHLILIPALLLTACFDDNGRTVFLDPISGPGFVLSGNEHNAISAVPGVLSIGDRNYERTAYITFYPTTGERIASGRFQRNYTADFGAVEASKTYQAILTLITKACMTDSDVLHKTGIESQSLAPAKHTQGPAYTLAVKCKSEQIPYNLR